MKNNNYNKSLTKLKSILKSKNLSYSFTKNKKFDITIYPIIYPYNKKYNKLSLYLIPNNEYSKLKINYNNSNLGYIDTYKIKI